METCSSSTQQQAAQPVPKQAHLFVTAQVCGSTITIAKRNLEYEDQQDPYFFEPDYSVAAGTGFLLWESSWVLIDLLNSGTLIERLRGRRVLELGSGTGLLGLCTAAAGAHVMLTDLPSVLSGILQANLERNSAALLTEGVIWSSKCDDTSLPNAQTATSLIVDANSASGPWAGARLVGLGSAAAMPLDWRSPIEKQIHNGNDASTAEVLLACDAVWLKELLDPLALVVSSILKKRPTTYCLLAFMERAKSPESQHFTNKEDIWLTFQQHGCTVSEYHRADLKQDDGTSKPVFILEICKGS